MCAFCSPRICSRYGIYVDNLLDRGLAAHRRHRATHTSLSKCVRTYPRRIERIDVVFTVYLVVTQVRARTRRSPQTPPTFRPFRRRHAYSAALESLSRWEVSCHEGTIKLIHDKWTHDGPAKFSELPPRVLCSVYNIYPIHIWRHTREWVTYVFCVCCRCVSWVVDGPYVFVLSSCWRYSEYLCSCIWCPHVYILYGTAAKCVLHFSSRKCGEKKMQQKPTGFAGLLHIYSYRAGTMPW